MRNEQKANEWLSFMILFAIVFWAGMAAFIGSIWAENEQLRSDLTKAKVEAGEWKQKHDELNKEMKCLREANKALIRYSTPKSINNAIKHSPLPEMKGGKQ